jgi:HTH-type transcriptional regulator / antitoxin HipB
MTRGTLLDTTVLIDLERAVRRLPPARSSWPLAPATRVGMTQPALSRLEAGGVVPTIRLLERITAALDADLIVELAPHAA